MEPSSFWKSGLVLALVLCSEGCAPGEPSRGWEGTLDTLPNGAVRVVNPAGGIWVDGGQWLLVPEVSIGELEGSPSEVFAAISGLEVDEEGRIFVLDRQMNELRIFSSEGEHLRTVGRSGGGPGEYVNANGLEWLSPDSLLVVDQHGERYSVLTGDGEFVRSVTRRLGFFGWAFRGGLWNGRIFEQSYVREGEDYLPAFLGSDLRVRATEHPDSVVVDTVMLPRPDAIPIETFSVRTERGGMTMSVPFAPSAVYHLDETGHLWHGHGSEFRIFCSTLAGDTLLEIVVDMEPAAVSEGELAEWEASSGPQRFRDMGGDLDLGRIPRVKPYFDGLYRDPEGFLWASVPTRQGETAFAVIDPDGKYLGRLDIEGFERVEWVDPVVRNGRLYVVGSDELDVQRVHVFRIER